MLTKRYLLMRKQVVVTSLFGVVLMSQAVNAAAPSSSVLEWRGFVGGAFVGTDVGLTGQGGGSIQEGVLNINEDGSFTSARAIIVEAHAVDTTGSVPTIKSEFYDGEVNWSISATNVSHAAYDVSNINVT